MNKGQSTNLNQGYQTAHQKEFFFTRVFTRDIGGSGVAIYDVIDEYKDWDDKVPQKIHVFDDFAFDVAPSNYLNTGFTPPKVCRIYCCN